MVPTDGFSDIFGAGRGLRVLAETTAAGSASARSAAVGSSPQALREGLGTLSGAGDTLCADFFNVGQGDCFLVTCGRWSILFDGGQNPSKRVLSELSQCLPATGDGDALLDVLCVSHYDADHIRGAAKVVTHLEGRVGHAFLPPFFNPLQTMDVTTGLLAERLRHRSLGEELSTFDMLAESLALRTEDGDINRKQLLGELRELLRGNETDFDDTAARTGTPSPQATQAALSDLENAGLPNLAAIVAAVLRLLRDGTQAGLDHETVWAAMLASTNAVVGAKAAVSKKAINATGLNELIETLSKYKVPFTTPLATDTATWFGRSCQICQLAPLPARVDELAHRLPVAVMRMLSADELSSLAYPDRLSASNELSSVFALRTDPGWSSGILASADAPFAPVPGQVDRVLASCSLIKWAHHGGRSGRFPDLMIDAAASITANSTHVVTTNRVHAEHHPRADFIDWMSGIAAHPGVDLRVTFANAPHPSVLNCPGWGQSKGPLRVSFEQNPHEREWIAQTSAALSCRCW
jgi:hypothetical protein